MTRDRFELRRTADPAVFTIHLAATGEPLGELVVRSDRPLVLALEGTHKDDIIELADDLFQAAQEAAPYVPLLSPFPP